MKKKLLSLLALVSLVSSCGTTQKTVSSHKPIVSRVPEKVLTESKHSETYINKEVPETPEELKATSAVKVTPALIREYINTYKDIAMVEMQRYGIPASITLAQAALDKGAWHAMLAITLASSAIMVGKEIPSSMMTMPKENVLENTNMLKPLLKTIRNS